MNNRKLRFVLSIVWLLLGIVLVGLAFAGYVDEFWNGMGSALLVVGAVRLLRHFRMNKNEEYREKVEIAESDERNHFISNKAWAWSGYVFMLTAAVSCIVFRILGQELLSLAASTAICFMLVVYWISYLILKKKY